MKHALLRLGLAAALVMGGAATGAAAGPWNGGKPVPPVEIATDLPAAVRPGRFVDVQVTVTPRRDCAELVTAVRTLDGAQLEGAAHVAHRRCVAGQPERHPLKVRVPAEVAGHLVVDVAMTVDGRRLATTRSFVVRAPGAELARKPAGRPGRDHAGKPIVVLEAR